MKTRNNKTIFWSVAIKVTVFLLLLFALYKQLYLNKEAQTIPEKLFNVDAAELIGYVLLLTFLMLLNWGIEAYKWQQLVLKITPIRFFRTFKAVWTGVTLGLFTPNRVGEFGGRILYVPRKFRIKAVIVSLIGSFSQNLATIIIGIIGLIIYLHQVEEITLSVTFAVGLVSAIAITLLLLAYYNLDVVVQLFKRSKYLKRIYPYTAILGEYHSRDLTKLLLLAFWRYSVYTAQYLIFLKMFGAEINIVSGISAIGVIYLAQTVIPSFAVVELLTRLPVATLIFSKYGIPIGTSLAATTSIWILNLILPAILGYIFIIRYNFFKNRQS